MTEEILALSDAPEPIETEVVDAAPEVEDEQKPESESSPDTDPQKGVEKRINELTRSRKDAERRASDVERDRDYWRDQAQTKSEPVNNKAPEEVKSLADFEYDEPAYQQYLFTEAQKGAVDAAKKVLSDDKQAEIARQSVSAYKSRESEFESTVDDYAEVARNPDLSINQVMADTIKGMDKGPEVLYYLGKNQDIADNIAHLPPKAADRELYRIEMRLETPKGEKVSKAPEPAPKIDAGNPVLKKDPDDMSQEEFNAHRRKFIANRR